MPQYINLIRRFHDLTTEVLESPDVLTSYSDHKIGSDVGWSELLRCDRVVILAEAGSGKTREMKEQVKRLSEEGRFAFFVELESLDRYPLVDLLSAEAMPIFQKWEGDGQATAWFFLDAVDELKLTFGNFERSLNRLARAITGNLGRARIIVSSRPNDWHPTSDAAVMQEKLPVPEIITEQVQEDAEQKFLEALRQESGVVSRSESDDQGLGTTHELRTVVMLPLSDRQIRQYVEVFGDDDENAFLAELGQQNAWCFARRPLDLAELLTTWRQSGLLGTREQQHENNITSKLRDNSERAGADPLTEVKAHEGAERLALALALTRTRALRSPDQALAAQLGEGVLDPAAVLTDWTEVERKSLLRRALFDPATYGRVRFHHRSVQEYLAARHLEALRRKGMSTRALFRLLFAENYGEELVYPSMREIAAWLALWDDHVCSELTKREPEALLSLGDPGSLNIGSRSRLVRAFVEAYGRGSWRGLDNPIDEIRRLAAPELGPLVQDLWGQGSKNTDVRKFLIELVWQGQMDCCADLVHAAALDISYDHYERVAAIRALLSCGRTEVVREIAEDMLVHPSAWDGKVVQGVLADIFPGIVSADELVTLMEQTLESRQFINGVARALRQIVDSIDPASDQAVTLRDLVADLVWRNRDENQDFYSIESAFGDFAPPLAILCDRQLCESVRQPDSCLIRACVIASRFRQSVGYESDQERKLRNHFVEESQLRSLGFWEELTFIDQLSPGISDVERFYQAEYNGLISSLTWSDRHWLGQALDEGTCHPARRAVALYALISLGMQEDGGLIGLREKLVGDSTLESIFDERVDSRASDTTFEESRRASEERQRERGEQEAQRLQSWIDWRNEIQADVTSAFSSANQLDTVSNLHLWLRAVGSGGDRYDVWNKGAILDAFGPAVANEAESAFCALWRSTTPLLWSSRQPGDRNNQPLSWIHALCGVSAEAATLDWSVSLSEDEAQIAAIYATHELNGFAPFIYDLVTTHPSVVDAVIGGELTTELGVGGEHNSLPILQALCSAELNMKRLLACHLLEMLPVFPCSFSEEFSKRWAHHLTQMLRILGDTATDTELNPIAEECAARYEADPGGALALVWLRGLFRFNGERGAEVLIAQLNHFDDPSIEARAIRLFAGLFGGHDASRIEIADPARRADVLGQLVRAAYAFIRRDDDQVHSGPYSPDTRDDAESARNYLLFSLLATPGPKARRTILELAAEPNFEHFPDRLRLLARHRAAEDAEFAPYEAGALVALETCCEAPPQDRDGLFIVMMDRLEDLAHDVAHNDFSDRRTLRNITDEDEMQRTLAWRLRAGANGIYTVSREDEVADKKRTDIRLLATRGDQKAVVEVKLADQRWSLSDLENALEHQLLGQYLRHATCAAGCLLLTYDGGKASWRNPKTKRRMVFSEMIGYLNSRAGELEDQCNLKVRLAVFGLDLTDPPLAPAHR